MLKKYLKKYWPIISILILATFLRLYKISDYMEFLGDQGRDVTIIKDFWQNGNLFFIGPQTSIGNMYLGPFFYYLIAPSLLISNFNPVGPAIFIALLNILTVYLIYIIAKRWFNLKTGLISAFLFAISPVVIKYSNFIWNPNIMPLFSLLFVYFFFESFRIKKYHLFTFASLSFVMVMNSHYLGLALLPFTGLYWLFMFIKFYKNKAIDFKPFLKYTLIAIFIFILSLTPQILFDIKHQGQNSKALLDFFTYRETTVNIKPYKAIPKLFPLFLQINTRLIAGKNEIIGLIVSLVALIGLAVVFLKRKNRHLPLLLIFFWYLSGLVALALYKQHIYDHYFAFLFPSVCILFGYLISKYKYIGYSILILITYFSFIENPFRWSPNYQLKTTQEISNSIINSANNRDFNFALLSKMGWGFSYYLTDKENYYKIDEKITDQLFVVCVPFQIECNPINNPEWSVAAFGWAKIDQQWEIDGIKIFKLIPNLDGTKK